MTSIKQIPLGAILTPASNTVVLDPGVTYRTAGIYSFGKGLFEREPVLGAATSYTTLYRLRKDQFVVSKLNGWEGAVDVAQPELDGCHVSSEYPAFTIDTERADAQYIRWIARWPAFWDQLVPRGSMVRRKRVQIKQLLDLSIPLPPIDEQRCVNARLNHARARTEKVSALRSKTEAIRRALAPSLGSQPQMPDEVKHAAGWRQTTLRAVMTQSVDRVGVDKTVEYPNVGIYSFGRGVFPKPPISGGSTSATSLFRIRAGQFIYSRLFAFEGAYATVPERFDGHFVSNEFPSFDADPDELDPRWLAGYLRDPERWADLGASSTGLGVRRQRVPIDALLDLSILLPPVAQQRRAAESMEKIAAAGRHADAVAARAAAIVPALLNREFANLMS